MAARPGSPAAISLRPAGTAILRDRYFDTQDWRLHRAGATLRIRTRGRKSEATLKSKGTLVDGMRDRRELTEPLPAGEPEAVRSLPGEVGRTVRALAGARRLRRLFEIRNRRRVFTVTVDGREVGELTLDDTSIPVAGGRPARLHRVEVEVGSGRRRGRLGRSSTSSGRRPGCATRPRRSSRPACSRRGSRRRPSTTSAPRPSRNG